MRKITVVNVCSTLTVFLLGVNDPRLNFGPIFSPPGCLSKTSLYYLVVPLVMSKESLEISKIIHGVATHFCAAVALETLFFLHIICQIHCPHSREYSLYRILRPL